MKKANNTKKVVKPTKKKPTVKKTTGWVRKGKVESKPVDSPQPESDSVSVESTQLAVEKKQETKTVGSSRSTKKTTTTLRKATKSSSKPKTQKANPKAKAKPKTKVVKTKPATKKDQPNNSPKLPDFDNIPQMKDFCVFTGLNVLPGYIMATKQKQVDFLEWITTNIGAAKNIENYQPKNNIELAKEMAGVALENKKVEEIDLTAVPAEMLDYGLCLEKYITESPSVRIHGNFPKPELDYMINTANKNYSYKVEKDEFGGFITMTNQNGTVDRKSVV